MKHTVGRKMKFDFSNFREAKVATGGSSCVWNRWEKYFERRARIFWKDVG